jgi:hypothetical protein
MTSPVSLQEVVTLSESGVLYMAEDGQRYLATFSDNTAAVDRVSAVPLDATAGVIAGFEYRSSEELAIAHLQEGAPYLVDYYHRASDAAELELLWQDVVGVDGSYISDIRAAEDSIVVSLKNLDKTEIQEISKNSLRVVEDDDGGDSTATQSATTSDADSTTELMSCEDIIDASICTDADVYRQATVVLVLTEQEAYLYSSDQEAVVSLDFDEYPDLSKQNILGLADGVLLMVTAQLL